MDTGARVVRRVRLRGASESGIRRGVTLLEDALRTASLPDTGGRIVLVRRLALGRFDPRAAPQTLALALEREVVQRQLEIAYAESDLPRASAVWFRDALDAHTRLALRLVEGRPVDAWYWPLAVRAWQRGSPVPAALRAIALSLAALAEAPSALPRWTAALCAAGQREKLVAALLPGDVAVLARAAGLPAGGAGPAHAPAGPPDDGSSSARPARSPAPSRVGRAGSSPAWRDDPRRALLRALLRAAGVRSADAREPVRPRARAHAEGPAVRAPGSPPRPPAASASSDARQADRPAPLPTRADAVPAIAHAPSRAQEHWAPDGVTTVAGGLLFLVPALVRLGYADWLADHPDWARSDLARRVLEQALARLDVMPDDLAWLLAAPGAAARAAPRRFVAPSHWRDALSSGTGPVLIGGGDGGSHALWDPSGRLLLGAWHGACPRPLLGLRHRAAETAAKPAADLIAAVAGAWLAATRRWLRRRARIGLSDLVLRPATLALTPTHADVHFDLAHADLRVRRAGLDLDPGWVPWLGRVLRFHYER
jgi:hypothetical protein